MNQIEINSLAWKLAGMEYSSGKTGEYWQELTGVNPANFPQYFQKRAGFHGIGYSVTDKFRREYKIVFDYKNKMSRMLTSF